MHIKSFLRFLCRVILEEQQKIMLGATELFMRIGIKSVSMDDIAREVGVSKKTIYKNFKDKKDLIRKVLEADIAIEKVACKESYSIDGNAIQKMINMSRHVSNRHKNTNPTIIYDLQKYYPNEWQLMEDFRTNFVYEAVKENLTEGQATGMYRENLDVEITCLMYGNLMQNMIATFGQTGSKFNFQNLHLQMVQYHLYGICTLKGREYLEQHIHEITN